MTTQIKKTMSEHAQTAAAIRKELKTEFPKTKFKVTAPHYSSVSVSWENGPQEKRIGNIVAKYQYGSFNGMEDIYEFDNENSSIPQARWVHWGRTTSDKILSDAFNASKAYIHVIDEHMSLDTFITEDNMGLSVRQLLNKYLMHCDLSDGFRPTMLSHEVYNDHVEPIN